MTAEPELRHCIKCGRQIGPNETLCEICNRAGMATPSATQYHGTVVVAIVAAVAALAVAASLSTRGVGPYRSEVTTVAPANPTGYAITFTVHNEGSRAGRATCRIVALGPAGERLRTRSLVTTSIDGGATLTVTEPIPGLVSLPARVTADCS